MKLIYTNKRIMFKESCVDNWHVPVFFFFENIIYFIGFIFYYALRNALTLSLSLGEYVPFNFYVSISDFSLKFNKFKINYCINIISYN